MQRGVKIVGGNLKRSRINIINKEGLRPTPNRVRETIFNWLMPTMPRATIIDCFAGSGILGLEALSRGAYRCTFIEKEQVLADSIQANINRFQLQARSKVIVKGVFDCDFKLFESASIIFADPPFYHGIAQTFVTWIQNKINPDCQLIIECASTDDLNIEGFKLLREQKAGNDHARLLKLLS